MISPKLAAEAGKRQSRTIIPVRQGECPVSKEPGVTFSTVLGSCISACVRDRLARVGGMNHFLLAEGSSGQRDALGMSARYGAHAMELLINAILSQGSGSKSNLEFKVFGGGRITAALHSVGEKNIAFLRTFIAHEGYAITSEDLGGSFCRRVLFEPHTGRAFVKRLDSLAGQGVADDELLSVRKREASPSLGGDIELF